MLVASNKEVDVLGDGFDRYLSWGGGGRVFLIVKKKKGERMGGEWRAREEEREFGMRADKREIREELSLFSHQNFSLIF